MVVETELFESPCLALLDFCFRRGGGGLMDDERSLQKKLDTRHELFPRILDAATCTKQDEDHLRRRTRDIRTRAAECTDVVGGIFQHVL
jgi:hypothetical protein